MKKLNMKKYTQYVEVYVQNIWSIILFMILSSFSCIHDNIIDLHKHPLSNNDLSWEDFVYRRRNPN